MKNKFLLVLFIFITNIILNAQSPSEKIFKQYSTNKGVEITAIAGFLIKPFAETFVNSLGDIDKQKIINYINNVEGINIAQTTNNNSKLVKEFILEANKLMKSERYTELISQTAANNISYKVFLLKKDDIIKELIGFGNNNDEALLVSIQGNFTEDMVKEALKQAFILIK